MHTCTHTYIHTYTHSALHGTVTCDDLLNAARRPCMQTCATVGLLYPCAVLCTSSLSSILCISYLSSMHVCTVSFTCHTHLCLQGLGHSALFFQCCECGGFACCCLRLHCCYLCFKKLHTQTQTHTRTCARASVPQASVWKGGRTLRSRCVVSETVGTKTDTHTCVYVHEYQKADDTRLTVPALGNGLLRTACQPASLLRTAQYGKEDVQSGPGARA